MTTEENTENIKVQVHTPTGSMTTQILPIPVVQRETTEEKNKRLCQILGLHWHDVSDKYCCSCVKDKVPMSLKALDAHYRLNTNFYTDAGTVQLLRELEKSPIGQKFFSDSLYNGDYIQFDYDYIHKEIITTTGLLADKVIEWRKNGNNS